jgi:hypothetical protein
LFVLIIFFNNKSDVVYLDQPVVKIILKPTKMYENKEYWFECIAEARPSITELVYV